MLGENGYLFIGDVRDVGGRERGVFLQQAKRDIQNSGRNCLADSIRAINISAWFEPSGRIRDAANTGFGEIDIEHRVSSWAADLSLLGVL